MIVASVLAFAIATLVFIRLRNLPYSTPAICVVVAVSIAIMLGLAITIWCRIDATDAKKFQYISMAWVTIGALIQMFAATRARATSRPEASDLNSSQRACSSENGTRNAEFWDEMKDVATFVGWVVIVCGSILAFLGVT